MPEKCPGQHARWHNDAEGIERFRQERGGDMLRRAIVMLAALVMGASVTLTATAGAATYPGRSSSTLIPLPHLDYAYQLGLSSHGGLHVTDPRSGNVYKVSNGTISVGRDHYGCPIGIAYDASGNEFVTDGCTGRLYEFAAGASTATVLVRHLSQGGSNSILIKWGRIILANETAHTVLSFNMDGTNPTTLLAGGSGGVAPGFSPTGIASVGNRIAVNDGQSNTIYLCDEGCATMKTITGVAASNDAQTLATGAGGSLLEAAGRNVWQRVGGTWTKLLRAPGNLDVATIFTTGGRLYYVAESCGRSKIIMTNLDGSGSTILYKSPTLIPVDAPSQPRVC